MLNIKVEILSQNRVLYSQNGYQVQLEWTSMTTFHIFQVF